MGSPVYREATVTSRGDDQAVLLRGPNVGEPGGGHTGGGTW